MAMLIFMQFHHGEWSAENLFIFPENVTHPLFTPVENGEKISFQGIRPPFLPTFLLPENGPLLKGGGDTLSKDFHSEFSFDHSPGY